MTRAGMSQGHTSTASQCLPMATSMPTYSRVTDFTASQSIPTAVRAQSPSYQTSRPLYHSDGLRAYRSDRLLMVEGETKGNLDLITLSGDAANIETLKGGFEGPVSLAQVGDTVYL